MSANKVAHRNPVMSPRIGIDATPLLVTKTGVGNYTHELIHALGQVSPETTYLLYANRPIPLDPKICHTDKPAHYLTRSRWLWMQTTLPFRSASDNLDLLHFTNNSAPLFITTPYILTIHDASLFLFGQFHPWQRRLALRTLLPLAARRAAAIITVSEHARRELTQVLNLPEEKIHVVYQAAGEQFRPISDKATLAVIQDRYKLPDHYILYVGTIEPRKNLPRLLKAFHQVKQQPAFQQYKLVIAGADGWLSSNLEKVIDDLQLQEAICWPGFIAEADLPAVYSLAACFTFPSLHEGFGMPPLEAMACGVPVITSHNSAMSEVCGVAAHYVNPTDVDSIAKGIIDVLSNPDHQNHLRTNGLAKAQEYSWQRTAKDTRAIYNKVI